MKANDLGLDSERLTRVTEVIAADVAAERYDGAAYESGSGVLRSASPWNRGSLLRADGFRRRASVTTIGTGQDD